MELKYTADQIADWFLCQIDREAGDSITHLKLQKLVYYAQAWSLALLKIELFEEEIEAWAHGPVVPSIYHKFKGFGWFALEQPCECPEIAEIHNTLLADVFRVYGECNAKHLEQLTHQEEPWLAARAGLPPEVASSRTISKELMGRYYRDMYAAAQNS